MWLPRRIESAIEKIEANLRAVQEVLAKQERATSEYHKRAEEERGEVPRIIARAIDQASDGQGSYERSQREKEYRMQFAVLLVGIATAIFTGLAFGAAAYYAYVAQGQLTQMIDSTDQARRSADVATFALMLNQAQFDDMMESNQKQFADTLGQMKRQARATQDTADATLAMNRPYMAFFEVPPYEYNKADGIVTLLVLFKNYGAVPAFNVFVKVRGYINDSSEMKRIYKSSTNPFDGPFTIMPGQVEGDGLEFGHSEFAQLPNAYNSVTLCITIKYEDEKGHQYEIEQEEERAAAGWPPTPPQWYDRGKCPVTKK